MRIVWAGIGGVGGYFGACTARGAGAGDDVIFFCRNENLQAIREQGITVDDMGETWSARPAFATDDAAAIAARGPVDAVFFCTKSYGLEAIASALDSVVGDDTLCVPFLNGTNAPEVLRDRLTRGIVLPGCVYINALLAAPGEVQRLGPLRRLFWGPKKTGDALAKQEALQALFERAGMDAHLTDDIDHEVWRKFMLISVNATVTTLKRVSVREIAGDAACVALYRGLCAEFLPVAAASGIELPPDSVDKLLKLVESTPPGATTSMANDAKKGNPTEIETLVGHIVREGKRLGVPTPEYVKAYDGLRAMGVR